MADKLIEQSQDESAEVVEPSSDSAGRKIAHYHSADKRAHQHGPIVGSDLPVGRQSREPCYETVHYVKAPGGFSLNETRYVGRVVVPQCIADYLTQMDREFERVERDLFRNNPVTRHFEVGR